MTFTRTKSALFSMPLFYRSDVVVFCEGGPSLAQRDVLSLSPDFRTLDTLYWSNFVASLNINKRFHFKSVGCKSTLKVIAADIAESGCTTASVCMDADYEIRLGIAAVNSAPRVAYTYGYSWESDVTHPEALLRAIGYFTGFPIPVTVNEIETQFSTLRADLTKWCEVDISLSYRKKPCVFDRERPLSALDFSSELPKLNVARLSHRLAEIGYKRKPPKVISIYADETMEVIFGKFASRTAYHFIVKIIRAHVPNIRIDYETFMRVCISETYALLRLGRLSHISAHIDSQRRAFA